MAKWTKNKVTPEQINNGNEYSVNDNLSVESVNAIINNSFKAQEDSEEALKKANSAYEANGTLVKINGENQVTWDATIAQKISEESKNIIPLTNSSVKATAGSNYIIAEYSEETGQTKFTTSGSGEEFTFSLIGKVGYTRQKYPSGVTLTTENSILLKPGTYTISSKKTGNGTIVPYACIGNLGEKGDVFSRTQCLNGYYTFTITENKYFSVLCYCIMTTSTDVSYLEIQLEEGSVATPITIYNPNRHITNSEAEFLKDEFGKQENVLDLTNSYLTYTAKDTYKAYNIPVPKLKDNTTYRLSHLGDFKTGLWLKDTNGSMLFNTLINETFTTTDASLIASCEMVVEGLVVGNSYTFNEETLKTMLTEGTNEPTKFYGYNTASHITNAQAGLLKSEWEKQVNILDFTKVEKIGGSFTYEISGSSLILTSTSTSGTGYVCIPFTFEKGKTYTFNYNRQSGYNQVVIFSKDLKTEIKYIKVTNEPVSFIYDNDITDVYIVFYCGYGNVTTYSDIILVYGSYTRETMPSYQPYNGKLLHPKDIEPVLLWKNATPTSSFPAQTITMSEDMSKFKKIIIACRDNFSDNRTPLNFEFSNITFGAEKRGLLFTVENSASQYWYSSRAFYFKTTTSLYFDKAYKNGNGNISESLIDLLPFAIYGVNY